MKVVFDDTTVVKLSLQICGVCQTPFAMPESKERKCRDNGDNFYCPNGHQLIYTDTELTRTKKKLADEKKAREQAEVKAKNWMNYADEKIEERDEARKDLRITRGQLTKTKKRVANSVCPCCNRFFPNDKLHQHIKTKHPDFTKEE